MKACNMTMCAKHDPHKVLGDSRGEDFFGVKAKRGHSRFFNCALYVHIPIEKRTKPKLSIEKNIFVVCSKTSKAYMIFNQGQRKAIVSRVVRFE